MAVDTDVNVEVVVWVSTVGLANRYPVDAPRTTVRTMNAARADEIPVRDNECHDLGKLV